MVKMTIKDIAKKINISAGTIDRVLKNRGGVSKPTELLVRKALADYNYEPNYIGVALSRSKKPFCVVIETDLQSPQPNSCPSSEEILSSYSSAFSCSAATRLLDGINSAVKDFSCYSVDPLVIFSDTPSTIYPPDCLAVPLELTPLLSKLGETAGNIVLLINKYASISINYCALDSELHVINGFLNSVNRTPIKILSQTLAPRHNAPDYPSATAPLSPLHPSPIPNAPHSHPSQASTSHAPHIAQSLSLSISPTSSSSISPASSSQTPNSLTSRISPLAVSFSAQTADIILTVADSTIICYYGESSCSVSINMFEQGYKLIQDIVNFAFCGIPLPAPLSNITTCFPAND